MGLSGLLLMLAAVSGGCNVIGAVAYKIGGQEDVPAQFELPKRPTVILAENFGNPDLGADEAAMLSRYIHAKMLEKQLVPMVGYEKIVELKSRQPKEFGKLTVPQIAQAVGAEQVIYVHLQGGGVGAMGGGSVLQGRAAVLVKVIDAKSGDRLWPVEISDGRAVSFETPPTALSERVRAEDIRHQLYDGLSLNIVRLFHKWKPGE